MPTSVIDLTGQIFTRLTVISQDFTKKKTHWNCICACGNTRSVQAYHLRSGASKSCGCFAAELSSTRNSTHGMTKTTEYKSYSGMHQRCYNPNNKKYPRYGARGIIVVPSWHGANGFINFYSDLGEKPKGSYSIERVNNDLNYSPDNCIWGDDFQQANNRHNNHTIEINGETRTLSQWCRYFNIPTSTVHNRIKNGVNSHNWFKPQHK